MLATGKDDEPMSSDRPNILLITTDQQHSRLMGCAGDPWVRTPSLDRLAASGTRFGLAYSANPVCVPCRYTMMTGRMPHAFDGLETNRKGAVNTLPRMRDWVDTPPMGRLLREAGYETVYGGKLHVEGPYCYSDEEEETYGFRCLTGDFDTLADRCADYLQAPHRRPFLLWASFDAPHEICGFLDREGRPRAYEGLRPVPLPSNFEPTRDEGAWMRGFRDGTLGDEKVFELGLNRRFGRAACEWTDEVWQRYRGVYRHFMERVDSRIGTILDALCDCGGERETVVIFMSNHGDHDGAHGLTMKRSFYEESAHVPLIIANPADAGGGAVDDVHLISNGLDLMPTLCDYAGIDIPASLPGRSLRALAEGREEKWRDFVVSETMGGRMVRTSRYKYALYCLDAPCEHLFDMDQDPGEMTNLAGHRGMRDVLNAHRAILADWTRDNGDAKGAQYVAMVG